MEKMEKKALQQFRVKSEQGSMSFVVFLALSIRCVSPWVDVSFGRPDCFPWSAPERPGFVEARDASAGASGAS